MLECTVEESWKIKITFHLTLHVFIPPDEHELGNLHTFAGFLSVEGETI